MLWEQSPYLHIYWVTVAQGSIGSIEKITKYNEIFYNKGWILRTRAQGVEIGFSVVVKYKGKDRSGRSCLNYLYPKELDNSDKQ